MIITIDNTPAKITILQEFLRDAGDSLNTFRYFAKRPLSIISNHLLTILKVIDNKPVGYGHLDLENNCVWLGICVAQSECGKSYGKELLNYLLHFADKHKLNLFLAVDFDNFQAIKLYQKNGFLIQKNIETKIHIMERKFKL